MEFEINIPKNFDHGKVARNDVCSQKAPKRDSKQPEKRALAKSHNAGSVITRIWRNVTPGTGITHHRCIDCVRARGAREGSRGGRRDRRIQVPAALYSVGAVVICRRWQD